MGGFGESFRYDKPQGTEQRKEGLKPTESQEQRKEGLKQNNEDLKNLTEDFVKPLLKDPVLSRKIPEIMDKHQELIDKGKEKPIVCLSEIINKTKKYLIQSDRGIYGEMESKKIFERYEECINKIIKTLDEAEYGEFFLNLRDTITEKIKNPENKENKREGELKFIPLVDNPEYSEWLPMFTLNSWYSWKYTPIP